MKQLKKLTRRAKGSISQILILAVIVRLQFLRLIVSHHQLLDQRILREVVLVIAHHLIQRKKGGGGRKRSRRRGGGGTGGTAHRLSLLIQTQVLNPILMRGAAGGGAEGIAEGVKGKEKGVGD